jgi:organic hydroperoxide reductase OsmC/OhrA
VSEYYADIEWKRSATDIFFDNKYSRAHTWSFDGGVTVPASSSPHVVPVPYSIEANVDPEEAFVAALSSCHMLPFLFLAADKKYVVDRYTDKAIGIMAKNSDGKLAMTEVTLRPEVIFGGEHKPTSTQIAELHHVAHHKCFIANSVKTDVTVAPV